MGIVFYELLTGMVPFRGKTATEIAVKHLREPIPFVREMNPEIPQSVENIILKATAKDPADRYENAAIMLYDLEHCLDPEFQNVKRLSISQPAITNMDIEDGHVQVEYNESIQEAEKEKSSLSFLSWKAWTAIGIALVLAGIALLMGLGVLRFDGVLGYKKMPDVVNMSEDKATEILEDNEFTNITIEQQLSDTISEGHVIKTNYSGGEVINKDSEIVIYVSKGSSYLVKDYTGLDLDDALEELEEDGIDVEVTIKYEDAADTNPGIILAQSGLEPGDRIDPSESHKVTFTISQYPTLVIPSSLIGMDVG